MESVQSALTNFWNRIKAWVQADPRRAAMWAAAIVLFLLSFVIRAEPPHVALAGEPLYSAGPRWLTNSLLTTVVIDLIVIVLAVLATARMKETPGGWQNFMEMAIEWLYGLAEGVAASQARKFFPWIATIFFFVIVSNWFGLIPGVGSIGYFHDEAATEGEEAHTLVVSEKLALVNGNLIWTQPENQEVTLAAQEEQEEEGHGKFVPLFRSPSADLNMTFALAITVMTLVQIFGVTALGGNYFAKFWNFTGKGYMKAINGYVGFLEIISEISRVIAFGFRLFGNIFAGEIILATMAFLITFWLPIPFYILEVFVGLVQAVVFAMLALIFFTMATISHSHESHEH
jgi:F-type H+-transporting ATPase subunit a